MTHQIRLEITDWRTVCAELIDALDSGLPAERIRLSPLARRARAALAETVGEGPTDEELLATLDKATADFPPRHPEAEALNAVEYPLALELRKARAVLARYGHQPTPPTAGEVGELLQFLRDFGDELMNEHGGVAEHNLLTRAADLLERHSAPDQA